MSVLSIAKFLFILLNLLLFLTGCAFVGLSVWSFFEARGFILSSPYTAAAVLLLLCGFSFIAMSMIALCGIMKRIHKLLAIYLVVLLITTGLLIICAICAFVFSNTLASKFRQYLYDSVREYFTSQIVQDSWDVLQRRFECCGVSPRDDRDDMEAYRVWQRNENFRREKGPLVPESCCPSDAIASFKTYYEFQVECQGQTSLIFRDDCFDRLKLYIKPRMEAIAFSSTAVILVNLLLIILTLIVMNALDSRVRHERPLTRTPMTNGSYRSSINLNGNNHHILSRTASLAPSISTLSLSARESQRRRESDLEKFRRMSQGNGPRRESLRRR